MNPILQVSELYAGYDTAFMLKDISFELREKEFIGLIGPNGSGKTTLLRVIDRILPVKEGHIFIDGKDICKLSRRGIAKEIAIVPQLSEPIEGLTVLEMVLLGRTPHMGRFSSESQKDFEITKKAMEETKTLEFADRYLTTLSGGEFQRVIIARALAQEPKLLLLDEPTAHLDIKYQLEILNLLKNLRDSRAILATFHDLNLAAAFCDRLILLSQGLVVAKGQPAEVLTFENIKKVYGVEVKTEGPPVRVKIV